MVLTDKRIYFLIRAALIANGSSLAQWADAKGYPRMTVYNAARGERRGPFTNRIRKQLLRLANV
ncbi:MAG: hypothetical protein VW338_08610 [Rhodospirillaceae bacterium]